MLITKSFTTMDTQVLGEVYRFVLQSPILLTGNNVHENNVQLQSHYSITKKLLLNEPRGHRGIHGAMVLPSTNANYQLLFFHHQDVHDFKYEGLIASLATLIQTGNIERTIDHSYRIETVKGIYSLQAKDEKNGGVQITLHLTKGEIERHFNKLSTSVLVDRARRYYLHRLPEDFAELRIENLDAIQKWGRNQTELLNNQQETYVGVVLYDFCKTSNKFITVTFEKDGYILRTPGIDTSLALMTACCDEKCDVVENETIFSSTLSTKKLSNSNYSLTCQPYIMSHSQFVFDEDDPLSEGFILA